MSSLSALMLIAAALVMIGTPAVIAFRANRGKTNSSAILLKINDKEIIVDASTTSDELAAQMLAALKGPRSRSKPAG